ncbi:uncharacterized protein LOC107407363 isoform X2 [Ziziphus jujuba]|uniref:Uncharacterized protein LOC107407363 isoform X2 n=1 Tax=Ziziphus jujuba TaxID=326968 RepID=A0A6P3YZ74_ZIZJJ|nr:uncharacterized protein LOC107407363 isoform X2 [Ziziphus jujuba]
MTMLPVCSAAPSCSSHSQISFHGALRPFSQFQKELEARCIMEDRVYSLTNGTQIHGDSFRTHATKSLYSNFVKSTEKSVSTDFISRNSCANEAEYFKCKYTNMWTSSTGNINKGQQIGKVEVNYVENLSQSATDEGLLDFSDQSNGNVNILSGSGEPEIISTIDSTQETSTSLPDSLELDSGSLSSVKSGFDEFFSEVSKSFSTSVTKGENAVKSSLETINSSISAAIKSANEAVDNAFHGAFSTVDQTGELAGNKLSNFSSDLKESTSKAADIAVDALRHTIVVAEDTLANGASFVLYSYQSAKKLLAPEIRDALNLSEEKAIDILRPAKVAFQQVYSNIEGLEQSLGLDPNDPIVPFVLFLGTSATLWVFYWVRTYSGYSGDLTPQSTLDILTGKENAVLIDIRPDVLRERDGVPDLRRVARFRYTSVTLPEVNGSLRKLLKSGQDLDDILTAAVIRNLKIVQDRSKVIVIDADGTRSKGVARSLRKLGVKKPYLVQGGFESWVKQSLRVKDLKAETTLTILNEEAEAILEDIRPSPVQVVGYGVGLIASSYALLEWEKTLQFIGVFGLAQTIFRRVASYENAEDLKQDVRLLLAPVRLGSQVFTWAAGKLESNRIGLPTSPSSLDVQNRVLQAAAKHESQPSDIEAVPDSSPQSTIPVNENVDLSEA